MNEMIYGNTGKRDEGINIDMDQSLYQKLQSRVFVPKLKSMLSDRLQEGDKSIIYIGEVTDKAENFSVYGYNAKLESDSRGGDYGHYIAFPLDKKKASCDIDNVRFLTEEGFVEYVNMKSLNEEKTFSIITQSISVDENAKKKIVNNLMEIFMKVRKRKMVTVSFSDCSIDEFNAKALYVLQDIIKFIPYSMRKNISFMSHVASNQKVPEMINLAFYPSNSEFKPHDCINIENASEKLSDGTFVGYVDKVFAMTDLEREDYFERLYNDIEMPAKENGVDIRSDLYLMDISTKELWINGDINEALCSMIDSVSDILKIYPEYKNIAIVRIQQSGNDVMKFIRDSIEGTNNIEELKMVYTGIVSLFNTCKFSAEPELIAVFKTKANDFIVEAKSDSDFIKLATGIADINTEILDQEVAKESIRKYLGNKHDINSIYDLYITLKERKYIPSKDLNDILKDCVEGCILSETEKYPEAKDKLSALERMYVNFQSSCKSKDSHIKDVYEHFKSKYRGNAIAEAYRKGQEILDRIECECRNRTNIFDAKNYLKEIAEIEVKSNKELTSKTTLVYKWISKKIFDEITLGNFEYIDFIKLIEEIEPAVKVLDEKEIYDNEACNDLFRLVSIFEKFIADMREADTIPDAILIFQSCKDKIKPNEYNISKIFQIFGPKIIYRWFERNSKIANEHNYKRAINELRKQGVRPSGAVTKVFETYLDKKKRKQNDKSSPIKIVIIGVLLIVILGGIGYGGYRLFDIFFGMDEFISEQDVYYTSFMSEKDYNEVKAYIESFETDNFDEAEILIGQIDYSKTPANDVDKSTNNKENVTAEDNIYNSFNIKLVDNNNNITNVELGPHKASKGTLENIDKMLKKEIAIVIQKSKDKDTYYIRDIYEIPDDFNDDFSSIDDSDFKGKIVMYFGVEKGLVEIK